MRYDGQCLTLNGADIFIFSGSFHYFRCPKPLWRDRFRKIKEAGCNAVETYVPWNWHERKMPSSPDDFSQVNLADLKEWLHMAHEEFGLYTIIRPGPYICAEWDGGGFPRWLLTKMPAGQPVIRGHLAAQRRSRVFLQWSQHWMEAVCPTIASEQVTRKAPGHGGVILVQIENEYDLYKQVPKEQRTPHLRALYRTAVASGIEVPIFTCLTRQGRDSSDPELGQVFDAVNSYPRMKIEATATKLRELEAEQPDAPAMISELQGGWFGAVGGKLSEDQPGLTPEQLNAHTLLAIQEGATLLNYYMIFGGTNFGLWGSRQQTTSYDYYAPIREPGGVGPKYLALAAIGQMLRQHGVALARSRAVVCQAETGSPDVTVAARRTREGATYLFFRNHSSETPRRGAAVVWIEHGGEIRVNYDLGAFGLKVLYLPVGEKDAAHGEWLPKPVAGPARPAHLPSAVRPTVAWMRADPGDADQTDAPAGVLLPELGVYDARTVVYGATVSLTAAQLAGDRHAAAGSPEKEDGLVVEVNGDIVASGPITDAALGTRLHPGENSIRVLYAQGGEPNFGPGIQDQSGLRSAELGARRPDFQAVVPVADWKLGRTLGGVAAGWPALRANAEAGWQSVALDTERPIPRKSKLAEAPDGSSTALATWYQVEFELPTPEAGAWVPWRALIDEAGDGQLYLNGQALGRVWEVGPQREFYLPECWLKFGPGQRNVLTFCLSPMKKGVKLRAVEISPYADEAEAR